MTGVSTDIGTSFVRPAGRVGDTLHAKASLTAMGKTKSFLPSLPFTWSFSSVGKSLAYTRVDFTNPAGELVAYGCRTSFVKLEYRPFYILFCTDHTKYVGKSSSHPVRSFCRLIFRSHFIRIEKENVKFTENGEDVIEGGAT